MTLIEVVHKRKLYLYIKNNIECKDACFITEIIKKKPKIIFVYLVQSIILNMLKI